MFGKSIVEYIGNVDNVVDLGCGFGYTTVGMKELFPNSNVYGTNLKDSYQYKMATELGDKHNFKIIENLNLVEKPGTSLYFASEYFEHFERPIEHLEYILKTLNPKYMLIANTFNGKAIGHFNKYKHYDNIFDGKKASKEFNNHLRKAGYKKQDTNCWNNRPSYWKKEEIK
jgi:trans-aconitate methyltransferase